jgi:REP element-mobilizing transposase RayT
VVYVDKPEKFADKFKTKSSRLNNWNYSQSGFYFITICTHNKNKFLGKIVGGKILLSRCGQIANIELIKTIEIRKNISIDPWVIMPNHIHLLINIRNIPVETPRGASLQEDQKPPLIISSYKNHPGFFSKLNTKSNQEIPKIINQFKSSVKRECNHQQLFFTWQSRYHDHIVRSEAEYSKIKRYIIDNPVNWEKDKFY